MTHSISLAIAPEFVSLGSIRRCAVIMAMAMVATLAQLGAALAVDYYWDANGAGAGIGGTGTWDTSSSLWRTPTDVGALTTWPTSGTANDAIFGGVAGTVTINAVTVHNIAINDVDGYTLSGINNLTFNGTTPTITVNQAATLSAPALGGTLLFAGRLAGAGTLTVGSTNNQRWLLNTGTNTNSGYTGDMIINSGGILEPRDTLSAATGNSVAVNAGGIFQILFSNTSINSLNGTGTVRGNGFDGGSRTLTVGKDGGSGLFSGTFQNNGTTLGLTKTGGGTQELSGTGITYTGTTSVAGGVLKLTDATAFNSNVTMNGGTLQLNGTAGTWTFGKLISNSAGGGVVKTGGGTVVLNQANSYIGGTTISNGTLYLDAGSAGNGLITLGDANTGASNVQLDIRNSGLGNAITVANQGTGTATIRIVNPAGGFTQSLGAVTLNRATTLSAPNLTSFLQFNGAFAGNGALTIGTTNNQRLILVASAASYSGDLTVQNSAIFEPRDMLSSAAGNSATLDLGGILQIVFSDTSINALNGAGTVRSNSFDGGGTRTLTLGKDNGNGAFSGTIIDNGHALALAKTGTGTQILSSASTYSGGTTINGGTLKITNVAGSATGSGLVTVNVNGTLSGVGSIVGGPVNLFGTVSPGNSVGTLFADSFNWQGGGTYQWEITSFTGTPGADWGLLNLTDGTLTFVGTGPFNLAIDASTVGIVPVGDYLFEIARADNISNFAVANFMLTATGPGNGTSNTNWSILRQGNRIFLQATVTPEPSTWVMFAIAGVLCAIGSRFATTRDRK